MKKKVHAGFSGRLSPSSEGDFLEGLKCHGSFVSFPVIFSAWSTTATSFHAEAKSNLRLAILPKEAWYAWRPLRIEEINDGSLMMQSKHAARKHSLKTLRPCTP